MRTKLYYSFLVLLVGSLFLTACDTFNKSNDFEESFQVFTDLEPVHGASNVTAVVNRGGDVTPSTSHVAGADSWFKIKLENIGTNDIINNGTVGGWCLEWKKAMRSNNDVHEGTKIYSTEGADKWKPMNYFFSIVRDLKGEDPSLTHREIQSVVWSLAGYMGIAPEFDLTTLSDSELPSRLRANGNGEAIVNKEKVISIVNRIKSEYKTASLSSFNAIAPVVMETDGDEQDVIIPDPPPVIEVDTNIFIYFDASGSMNATLFPLQTMRNTQLKDALLPLYDGDGTAYDNRVQVVSWCGINCEGTFAVANLEGAAPPADGNIVVLIFQDEAVSRYHPSTLSFDPTAPRRPSFDSDITALRSRLDTWATTEGTNYYRSVIFQVDGFPGFKTFVESVQNGDGNYAPPFGLSDRNEFNYVYDVVDGDTPTTYRDLVIQALQDLGFAIPTP